MKSSFHRLALLLLAVTLLAVAGSSAAQTRIGNTELGFSFDLDDLTEGDDTTLRFGLRAGHYVGERFELGAELSSRGTFDTVTDNVTYRLFGLYEFNPGSKSVWYGRGGYSGVRFDAGSSTVSVGFLDLGLGVKNYLRDDTALYWETTYGYVLSGPFEDDVVRSTTGLICTF